MKLPCGDAAGVKQGGGHAHRGLVEVGTPGRRGVGGTAMGRGNGQAVQEPEGRWSQPMIEGIVDEGHDRSALRCGRPRGGVIARGLGIFTPQEVIAMGFPGCGRSRDHDISRHASAIWREGDEVGSFGLSLTRVNILFRVRVPARLAAETDPGVAQAIVTA